MTAEYARTEWDRALEAFTAATLLLAHGGFDSARDARTTLSSTRQCPVRPRGPDIQQTLCARGCGPPRSRQGGKMVSRSRARLQLLSRCAWSRRFMGVTCGSMPARQKRRPRRLAEFSSPSVKRCRRTSRGYRTPERATDLTRETQRDTLHENGRKQEAAYGGGDE